MEQLSAFCMVWATSPRRQFKMLTTPSSPPVAISPSRLSNAEQELL